MGQYLIAHIGHTTKLSEHICWWNPDSKGYTICIDKAGLYDESEARKICQSSLCIAVPKQIAQTISRSTPYYRLPDGNLARLYDGGPHCVVPNSLPAWKDLLSGRLAGCAHPTMPTPIGAKSCAIYIDAIRDVAEQHG